jgi:Holliday junction resolvase
MRRKTKRKTKNRVPKNRTRYEGELVKLIGTQRRDVYVSPSGNTAGWDVFVVKKRGRKFIPIEVKTSSTTKHINLAYNERVKKQYEKYLGINNRFQIVTWYAFRHVSRKGRRTKEEKWSFVPINNITQMVLSFEDGLTLKEFLKVII